MTKSRLLAVMALTLILTGCGESGVTSHEYELCNENGEMVEYIVERPGEAMPEGVGPAIQLYKIAGDDHLLMASLSRMRGLEVAGRQV